MVGRDLTNSLGWWVLPSNRPKVIITSQITPCFLGLITASTDLDLIN